MRHVQARRAGRKGLDLMLQLRPNCECCDRDLSPASDQAMICSFECTFCRHCAEQVLGGRCPNCGGNLVPRPIRPAAALKRFPASVERKIRTGGCPQAGGAAA